MSAKFEIHGKSTSFKKGFHYHVYRSPWYNFTDSVHICRRFLCSRYWLPIVYIIENFGNINKIWQLFCVWKTRASNQNDQVFIFRYWAHSSRFEKIVDNVIASVILAIFFLNLLVSFGHLNKKKKKKFN